MILVDAIYINNGGGKILLDYLIRKLESEDLNVYYLLDSRCEHNHPIIINNKVEYIDSTLKNRYSFYLKNKKSFSKILCFGNIPPLVKMEGVVYTYFHQPMYLNIPKEFGFKERLKFKLKQRFLSYYKSNTNFWFVQNEVIKTGILNKFGISDQEIIILPFYPNEDLVKLEDRRVSNSFIYVSNATPHKNYLKLLEAFCLFYDANKIGKLTVTVSSAFKEVYTKVEELIDSGYPIRNIGYVGREELIKNYNEAEYLIFPSLEESFGLGIVEAIECGCKVIGADLPYMYQVCDPSIIFDPLNVDSIVEAFGKAIRKEEKETKQRIFNEIDQLIWLLKK